jgi:hypothetical protein
MEQASGPSPDAVTMIPTFLRRSPLFGFVSEGDFGFFVED